MTAPSTSWRDLFPYTAHYTDVGGHRLHYVDEGEGHPVVMLHGNPTWSFMYRDVIADLAPGKRAIAVDNIGCGLSDKPQDYPYHLADHVHNLEKLLNDDLGLNTMDLVMHDWGGAIAMGYATRHPERIRRLVVMNTAAFILPRCPLRIRICRLPVFGALAVRGCNGFVRAALRFATARPQGLPPAVRQGYLAPYDSYANRIATLRFVQDIPMHRNHPTWDTLTCIHEGLKKLRDKPMLICWGTQDFCFNHQFLDVWRSEFPDARVVKIPEAGHYLIEDAGPQVISEIHGFLEGDL